MDQFEERLAEEVRKYEHLYNPSLKNYKDAQVIYNSWKEIARILEVDVEQCMKKWRSMRDKFVRMKKTLRGNSGDPGGKKVPAFYVLLSWLEPHIKHRPTSSNFEAPTETPQDQASCGSSQDEAPSQLQGSSLPASRQQQDESSPHPVSSHSSSASSNSSPSLHASLARESVSTDQQTADELLESTSTPRPALKKRRRQQHVDDCLSEQMARIDKRRKELSEMLQKDDEYDRFGQVLADLLRKVPEHKQVVARRNLLSCVCDLLED
ncbi:transcription factor Adf-1-like [Nothobranchius furzeri]|uniref:transcription factor Adf-1-like n=1 Tax=Nothobranchius furzeri TaxID=105023 RepID=UPI00390495BB